MEQQFLDYSLDDGLTWTNIYNVIYGSVDDETATSGANDGGAGTAWTDPSNITDFDNFATITALAHASVSQNLLATDFTFAIPSGSTIDGITVAFDETRRWKRRAN